MPEMIPIACTLEQAELPGRAELMARLGESLEAVDAEGLHARLRFPFTVEADLRQFVADESTCCPFFDFELIEAGERLELRVGAPEDGEWAVRGLVAGFVAGWGDLV